ncbi:hypothetical protein AK88_01182 [Plasmodium fragile]|uniref:MCM C-terminal AAA(+) ATPase domain-containing protein n=1 Tax=Plasmodium fragile TaxID=5857 RepID=A0A0D9QTQ4_PLAFR|nr:uncharacterized protein AK88_01182 [Plasmodium fragile]KJP89096.1 hypothetical protein AK88_01182 [Plasmodium fragile]
MLLSSSESSIFSDTDYDVSSEDECNYSNTDEKIKNVKYFHKKIIKLFLKNRKYYEQIKKIALSYISKIEDIQFSNIQNNEQQGSNEHIYNFYFDPYDAIQHGENKLIYYMQNSFHKFIDVMNNYSIPFFFRLIFLSCYFEFLYSREVKQDVGDSDFGKGRNHSPTSHVDNRGEATNAQWGYTDGGAAHGYGDILKKGEHDEATGRDSVGEEPNAGTKCGSLTEENKNEKGKCQNGSTPLKSDEKGGAKQGGEKGEEELSPYNFIVYNFSKDKMVMEEIDMYSSCLIKGILYSYKDYSFLKDENTKAKINNCLKMIFDKQNIKIICRVENVPYLHDIHISYLQEIRNKHIGKFISTEGIITRVGEKKILEECKKYRCTKCDKIIKKKAIPELYYNTQMVFKCPYSQINPNIPPSSSSSSKNNLVSKEVSIRRKYMNKDMGKESRTGKAGSYINNGSKFFKKNRFYGYANYRSRGYYGNKRSSKWNFSYRAKYYNKNTYSGNKCNGTNFEFLENEVKRVDYQEIRIKETSKTNIPYSVTVVLLENLAGKYHPGKKVIINGIILRRWKKLYKDIRCESELFIEANNVQIKQVEGSRGKEVALDDEFAKCINALTNEAQGRSSGVITVEGDRATGKARNTNVNDNLGGDPEGNPTYDEKGRPIRSAHVGSGYCMGQNSEQQREQLEQPQEQQQRQEEECAKNPPCGSNVNRIKNNLSENVTDVKMDVPERTLFEKYWLLFKKNKFEGKRHLCDSMCPNLYNCKMSKIAVLLVLIGGNKINESDSFYNENNKWKKYFNRSNEEAGTASGGHSDEDEDEDDGDEEVDEDDDEEVDEDEEDNPSSCENRRVRKAKNRKWRNAKEGGRTSHGHENAARRRRRGGKTKHRKGRGNNFSSDNCDKRTLCHLLLVGDPGTGKSQLLKEVQKISSICTNVSGMFCTTAGLTCAAIKEGNNFMLESGALVLADNGVCCIDEFCLMKNENKNAIHEAMEQLTISVAKGGIVDKLHCRCTIIGASNFELHKTATGNLASCEDKVLTINLSYPLLSRFDMVVITEDNNEIDSKVADYVLSQDVRSGCAGTGGLVKKGTTLCRRSVQDGGWWGSYTLDGGSVQKSPTKMTNERRFAKEAQHANFPEEEEGWTGGHAFKMPQTEGTKIVWSCEKLKEYIYYVKNNCSPNFNKNSKLILITYYSMLRKHNDGDNGTTVRTLESLIRLSEAHSKMMHSDTVSSDDVINIVLLSELSLRGYKIAAKTNSNNILIARSGILDNLSDSLLFYNNIHSTLYSLDDVLFYESLYNYFKKLLLEKLNLIERGGEIHTMAL